jgi:hypothetical protein
VTSILIQLSARISFADKTEKAKEILVKNGNFEKLLQEVADLRKQLTDKDRGTQGGYRDNTFFFDNQYHIYL